METLKRYLNGLKIRKEQKRKALLILICLSVLTAGSVTWSLHITGEGRTGETYCGIEEHEHTLSCYSNPDARETKTDWEAAFSQIELSGIYADDLITIAKTQLGYQESTENYETALNEEGEEEISGGYTRYGDWYGDLYAEWSAMFASFCLYYSDIDLNTVPYEQDCQKWIEKLERKELYYDVNADYTPLAGDLVFFDTDQDGTADHCGIIEAIDEEKNKIYTIEGDSDDRVQEQDYSAADSRICGYLSLPVNEEMEDQTDSKEDDPDESSETSEQEESEDSGTETDGNEETEESDDNDSEAEKEPVNDLPEEDASEEETEEETTEDPDSMDWETMSNEQKVAYVISLIDALPDEEELADLLLTIDEEDDEFILWFLTMQEQVAQIWSYYSELDEEQKEQVTNADLLLAYYSLLALDELADTADTVKEAKDNSDQLHTVQAADTSSFITLNLYDYGDNINELYNLNNSYLLFAQDGGSDDGAKNQNFGNNIVTDLNAKNGDSISAVTDNTYGEFIKNLVSSGINYVWAGGGGQSIAVDLKSKTYNSPMKMTLVDGYPELKSGISLKEYFSDGEYATKQNTANVNYLFKYDDITGLYTYNSRENHAQFDKTDNTFTLYQETITSCFMPYPFGNFLPFNDIVTQCKKSSEIDADYLKTIIASAKSKADSETDPTYKAAYSNLAKQLTDFLEAMKTKYKGEDWTAADAAKHCFETYLKPTNGTVPTFTNSQFDSLYTIDFDEATNFFFGMDMQMKFVQSKNGVTSKNQEMILRFTGDDDVLFYIDGILFLDLSGVHRHCGGEIDFKNGVVRYYNLDKTTGDVGDKPVLTRTFEQILKDAGENPDKVLNGKGTFEDYSSHTLNWYYMERGSGSGVCRLEFNMEQVVPSGVYKIDQYGEAVPGARFAAYPASKTSEGNYVYLDDDGSEINALVVSVDENTGVITFADDTTLNPKFVGETDSTGQMIFSINGESMTLAEMQKAFGDHFILREIYVPDGYRTVAEESWMYFSGDLLLCDNTITSGTWASANATAIAPNLLYYADSSNAIDPIQYYKRNDAGDVTDINGTLFAVVLKKNNADYPYFDS